jgi:hypothetical protein
LSLRKIIINKKLQSLKIILIIIKMAKEQEFNTQTKTEIFLKLKGKSKYSKKQINDYAKKFGYDGKLNVSGDKLKEYITEAYTNDIKKLKVAELKGLVEKNIDGITGQSLTGVRKQEIVNGLLSHGDSLAQVLSDSSLKERAFDIGLSSKGNQKRSRAFYLTFIQNKGDLDAILRDKFELSDEATQLTKAKKRAMIDNLLKNNTRRLHIEIKLRRAYDDGGVSRDLTSIDPIKVPFTNKTDAIRIFKEKGKEECDALTAITGYDYDVDDDESKMYIYDSSDKFKLSTIRMNRLVKCIPSIGRKEFDNYDGNCVIKALVYDLSGKDKHNKVTYQLIENQMKELDINPDEGVSFEDIKKWAIANGDNISIHAVNMFKERFDFYIPEGNTHRTSFVFMLQDGHCYLIEDKKDKDAIIRSAKHDFDSTTFKPFITHDNYEIWYVSDSHSFASIVERLDNPNTKEHIFIKAVEPADKSVELADIARSINLSKIMEAVVKRTECYVEYLHFAGDELSGFIHPKTNKKILNHSDIQECILICQTMKEFTKSELWQWKGETLTNLSSKLFSHWGGSLQKSVFHPNVEEQVRTHIPKSIVGKCMRTSHDVNLLLHTGIDIDDDTRDSLYEKFAVDVDKSYSDAILNGPDRYPVFGIADDFVPFDQVYVHQYGWCALFKISTPIQIGLGLNSKPIYLNDVIYSGPEVEYFLKNKYITCDDIEEVCYPSRVFDATPMKTFVREVYNLFDKSLGKTLINNWVGCLARNFSEHMKAMMTDSIDMVKAMLAKYEGTDELMTEHLMPDEDRIRKFTKVDSIGQFYYLRKYERDYQLENHTEIRRWIIDQAKIRVLEMLKAVRQYNNSHVHPVKVVCIKTDAVHMLFPKYNRQGDGELYKTNTDELGLRIIEKADAQIGDYRPEIFNVVPFVDFDIPILTNAKYPTRVRKVVEPYTNGYYTWGWAGVGKSYGLAELYKAFKIQYDEVKKQNKKVIVLTPYASHRDVCILKDVDKADCLDFDQYFLKEQTTKAWVEKISKLDCVFVDELGVLQKKWLTVLYMAIRKNPKLELRVYHGRKQCLAIEDKKDNVLDYFESSISHWMFPDRCEKEFVDGKSRFPREVFEKTVSFVRDGIPINHEDYGTINPNDDVFVNICYTNAKRNEVNLKCMFRFLDIAGMRDDSIQIYYNGTDKRKVTVELCEGMPIVCRKNHRRPTTEGEMADISNNNGYVIEYIDEDHMILKRENHSVSVACTAKDFHGNFELNFCSTVDAFQGGVINGPFNIYENQMMIGERIYTSITRTSALTLEELKQFVRFETPLRPNMQWFTFTPLKPNLIPMKKMRTGVVYKIENTVNNRIYIGITEVKESETHEDAMEDRFQEHIQLHNKKKSLESVRSRLYTDMIELGSECFKISMIGLLNFERKKELEYKEFEYIQYYSVSRGYNSNMNDIFDVGVYNILGKNSVIRPRDTEGKFELKKVMCQKYKPHLNECKNRISVWYYSAEKCGMAVKDFNTKGNAEKQMIKAQAFLEEKMRNFENGSVVSKARV